jgi:hypothetical protein
VTNPIQPGDLIFADHQYEWRGLLFGSRTKYRTESIGGLFDALPGLRSNDMSPDDRHGLVPGSDLLGGRTLEFDLHLLEEDRRDPAEIFSDAESMMSIFRPLQNEQPFYYRLPGREKRYVMCRPRRATMPKDADLALGHGVASIQMVSADGVHYSSKINVKSNDDLTEGSIDIDFQVEGSWPSAPLIAIDGAFNELSLEVLDQMTYDDVDWIGNKFTMFDDRLTTENWIYSGAPVDWVVPANVDSIIWDLWGAHSGDGTIALRSRGGHIHGVHPGLTPGDTYQIRCGYGSPNVYDENDPDWDGVSAVSSNYFNDGGATHYGGTRGGGATDIRYQDIHYADRVLVAGGAGGCNVRKKVRGGDGGASTSGGWGEGNQPGHGGTSSAGGDGGGLASGHPHPGADGDLGTGGYGGGLNIDNSNGLRLGGGGGGGGYYGGGGGCGADDVTDDDPISGGGGGSNFADSSITDVVSERGIVHAAGTYPGLVQAKFFVADPASYLLDMARNKQRLLVNGETAWNLITSGQWFQFNPGFNRIRLTWSKIPSDLANDTISVTVQWQANWMY